MTVYLLWQTFLLRLIPSLCMCFWAIYYANDITDVCGLENGISAMLKVRTYFIESRGEKCEGTFGKKWGNWMYLSCIFHYLKPTTYKIILVVKKFRQLHYFRYSGTTSHSGLWNYQERTLFQSLCYRHWIMIQRYERVS